MVTADEFFSIYTYMKYATIPSTLILVVLTVLEQRKTPNKCGYHRPALVVPMRFLDGYQYRWAYALSFGAITAILLSVFVETVFSSTDGNDLFCSVDTATNTTSTLCQQTWVKTLKLQAQSLIASLVCAPHFVCITTSYKLVGALLGFAYSVYWIVFYIFGVIQREKQLGALMGTGHMMQSLPIILCFVGLCIRSIWTTYHCYKNRRIRVQEVENVAEPHQVNHTIALLRQQVTTVDIPQPKDLKGRIVSKVRAKIFPFFQLPTRIICMAFVQLILIYYIGLGIILVGIQLNSLMKHAVENLNYSFGITLDQAIVLHIFDGTFAVAAALGLASSLVYVILFVVNYRYSMIRIYKGKKQEYLEGPPGAAAAEHVARSLRLPGYQIAYIIWGLVVVFAASFVILAFICYIIYVLWEMDMLLTVLSHLAQVLSVPIMTMAIFYVQVLLVRVFLLQPKLNKEDEHAPLNVDNRHVYEVVSYVLVFSNLLVGIASALFRTAKSFVLGVIFLGRLDRCLLMKGFEQMDPGYMAYVGTLLVDNAHNNPVMRTFCAVLISLKLKTSIERHAMGVLWLPSPEKLCSNSRSARRWHLAYTLIHNPDLLPRRKLAILLTRGLESEDDDNNDNNKPNTLKNGQLDPAASKLDKSQAADDGAKYDEQQHKTYGSAGRSFALGRNRNFVHPADVEIEVGGEVMKELSNFV